MKVESSETNVETCLRRQGSHPPIEDHATPTRQRDGLMFYAVAAAVVLLDQLTKLLARGYLAQGAPKIIVRDFLWFRYAENTGGAFSMLSDHSLFLTIVSFAAVAVIFVWHFSLKKHERWQRVALGLIFGGAVGNLFDRLVRGYVVDFIDAHWYNRYHWPTFNLADSAICIGIGLFIVTVLFVHRGQKPASADESPEQQQESQ